MANEKVVAFIEVNVEPERGTGFDSTAERVYKFPEVISAYLLSGKYDLLVVVEGQTLQEVSNFVSQKLSTIGKVQRTTTHFLLKKYKENGNIFAAAEKPERLSISP